MRTQTYVKIRKPSQIPGPAGCFRGPRGRFPAEEFPATQSTQCAKRRYVRPEFLSLETAYGMGEYKHRVAILRMGMSRFNRHCPGSASSAMLRRVIPPSAMNTSGQQGPTNNCPSRNELCEIETWGLEPVRLNRHIVDVDQRPLTFRTSGDTHFISQRAQQKSLTENNSLPGLQGSTQFND
jgi:hypothetical protein